MTPREQQILAILRENPMIAQQELAQKLAITRSAVAGHIMNLTHKGLIKGKGYILTSEPSAVVVGGANMDLCGKASAPLRSADSNPGTIHASPGGVARNIADNLARLGSKVELISCVGNDEWGAQLLSASQAAGVGVDHVLRSHTGVTATYLSIHDADGEMQLALNDMRILEQLDASVLARHKALLSHGDVLLVDANLHDDALAYLFNCIDHRQVYVDPVSANKAARIKPYLSQITLLKPNLIEAELLSGIGYQSERDLPAICQALHDFGVQQLVISLGAGGIYASRQAKNHDAPPQTLRLTPTPSHVVNVTGAGDALMAGLIHGKLQNWPWQARIEFAFACAHLATQSADTINPHLSQRAVHRFMEIPDVQ